LFFICSPFKETRMARDDAPRPIPVICDRCRAEGQSGEDPFAAFGALLDFEPVPRRAVRADGWDAEVQRAYIAALSLTGSDRAACRAVGRSAFGVTQLIAHEGSESFRAAREEALAIAGDERSRRLAEGLRTVAAEQSGWRPPDPPWSRAASRQTPLPSGERGNRGREGEGLLFAPEPELEDGELTPEAEQVRIDLLRVLSTRYLYKLEAERRCRLEGRIAEADFYIRQVTALEVSLDVVSGNAMELLKQARLGGHGLLQIAETTLSRILDEARARHFENCGDPPRPDPPRHLFVEHDGYATEPLEVTWGGLEQSHDEQTQAFEDQHKRDAEAQVAWEAEARRDYEERRERDASS
jgi:hypothetical protein